MANSFVFHFVGSLIATLFIFENALTFYYPDHYPNGGIYYPIPWSSESESESISSEEVESSESGEGGKTTTKAPFGANSTESGNGATDTSTPAPSGNGTETGNGTNSKENKRSLKKGRPAEPGEAPYQLSLWLEESEHFTCGASLVESAHSGMQFGITAAHCLTLEDGSIPHYPEEYTVKGGNVNLHKGQTLRLAHFMVPSSWRGRNKYDIALLFFHGQFKTGDNLKPIMLPEKSKLENAQGVLVTGWSGMSADARDIPDDLQIMMIPKVSTRWCNGVYMSRTQREKVAVGDSQFCAGFGRRRSKGCPGDSGGPAVVEKKGEKFLVGVVSYGDGCARPDLPGVYTRVYKYMDWILTNVGWYEFATGVRARKKKKGNGTETAHGKNETGDGSTTEKPVRG